MAHISTPDPSRPFGLTTGEARFVLVLSPDVKWRTSDAVQRAYLTLLFDDYAKTLRSLYLKIGRGCWEIVG